MVEELRCPKCKRNSLFFFEKNILSKDKYYKCFQCGFIAVPTGIRCRRCKNEKYNLLLAKDGILYCVTCWFHPLCSADRLQEAVQNLRSVLARIK
jgi:hypothetical protein